MTHINAYLNFNGHAKQAMTFYKECLGGELVMQKIAESPMAAQMPGDVGNKILHSTLTNKGLVLMASDRIGNAIVSGSCIALCLNCSSAEEISHFFEGLSAGGTVLQPLHQSFWGATLGHLTDKFGINWMLHYSKK